MQELSDKEFRIIFLKKFSKLQECIEIQANKTRLTMCEKNEILTNKWLKKN